MRVIPDNVLESLTCRKCCKYLTVCPIGVHPDGGNVCGRCLYGKTACWPTSLFECQHPTESAIPMSLLGYATYPDNLFPCVNRFEGCDQLLPFSLVRSHERGCVYKKFQCPLCRFEGVGTQLVHHFKTGHNRYLTASDATFQLKLDGAFCETYLYRSENSLFLVKVRFVKDITQFAVDTVCLGSAVPRVGRVKLVFRVPAGRQAEEFELVSDRLSIARDSSFNMTFKIGSFRVSEAKTVVCVYKVVYVE